MLHKIKNNRHVKNYIQAVKPPYTKHDIPHIVGTLVVVVVVVFSLYTNMVKFIHASNSANSSPTKPQILIGIEHPLHIPFTHAEQGIVYIYWLPSTDPVGVSGYRIYRNETKIGNTNITSYEDSGVSGSVTYTIEAYDEAGNTAKSTVHLNLPAQWAASVTQSDMVISGFVLNKNDNNPISSTTITVTGGTTIHTAHNGYYYYVIPGGKEGQVQLTVNAKGFNSDTEKLTLIKGKSVKQTFYLNPQSANDNSITNLIMKFVHKIF